MLLLPSYLLYLSFQDLSSCRLRIRKNEPDGEDGIPAVLSTHLGAFMSKLKTIESRVLEVLRDEKKTRDDDMLLYFMVCQRCFFESHGMRDISFNEFIYKFRDFGCPNFESVRRTRQMIQSQYPELGCSPKARRARSRGQKAYEKYAKEAAENGEG